jgi:hypothetical protein
MIAALLIAVVMFFAIQLLQKDRDAVEFSNVFIIALAPTILVSLLNFGIAISGISEILYLVSFLIGIISVFFLSKYFFDWKSGKASILTSVYLISNIGFSFGLASISA